MVMPMGLIGILILSLSGLVNGQTQRPSITLLEAPGIGIYDIKCDLDYSDQCLSAIIRDLENRYGFSIATQPFMSDVHFHIEGDSDDIDLFVYELCERNNVHLDLMYIAKTRMAGLSGKKEDLDNVINILKDKFSITNIKRHNNIQLDLHGKQMAYGEVIFHLAKKSGLGISYHYSTVELLRNDRRVLAYTKAEPFHIYLSKEAATEKLIIDLLYNPNYRVEDNSKIELRDVVLHVNGKAVALSGCNLTTERNPLYPGRIEWISDSPVEWNDKIIVKGVVQGRLLHREYQVDNLQYDSTIKAHDLRVQVYKTCRAVGDNPEFGIHWVPDTTAEGDWMCIDIETQGLLSKEEKKFISEIEGKKAKGQDISKAITEKYESLVKEQTSMLRVTSIGKPVIEKHLDDFFDTVFGQNLPAKKLEHTDYVRQYEGIDPIYCRYNIDATKIFLDGIQNDEGVFPIGLHIREYRPAQVEFVMSTVH